MGLHNWIQFYLQEKHNHVDYKGYKARDNKDTVRKHCITGYRTPNRRTDRPQILLLIQTNILISLLMILSRGCFVAWWRRPRPQLTVQLEGLGEAHRWLLHRRESRVWGRSFHHPLPHFDWEDDICGGQNTRVPARAGCLSAWTVHRHILPQTDQQQQQRFVDICHIMIDWWHILLHLKLCFILSWFWLH